MMFYGCTNLLDIHTIENWNVPKDGNYEAIFGQCDRTKVTKAIQKWNIPKEQIELIEKSAY